MEHAENIEDLVSRYIMGCDALVGGIGQALPRTLTAFASKVNTGVCDVRALRLRGGGATQIERSLSSSLVCTRVRVGSHVSPPGVPLCYRYRLHFEDVLKHGESGLAQFGACRLRSLGVPSVLEETSHQRSRRKTTK